MTRSPRDTSLSRRDLFAAGAGLAAIAQAKQTAAAASAPRSSGPPFDTLRDYFAALEDHGLVLRIPRVDQDAYEATGLFFRATDKFGMYAAPAMIFDEVKIDGAWVKGPVVANHQGHWITDAIIWGLPVIAGDHFATYRGALDHMTAMLGQNRGAYPAIEPREIDPGQALCKEVVLTGDAIDVTAFPFLKTNPADGGRYVNSGSVFMDDPELGPNFGTYRCQIRGPRLLGLNPEPGQTGHRMLIAARERGEDYAPVSIVLGQDPVVWMISGTRVAPRWTGKPVDELAIAGGMRGQALDVVKSHTNDLIIPAHAEMVIEGRVPLRGQMEPEGPFGEMFGYLGRAKEENFVLEITAITHRRDPWIMNAFTGMQRGMVTAPMDALYSASLKRSIPNFVDYHGAQDTMGVVTVSIDKKAAGEGLAAGRAIAQRNPIAKVVIVVDKDINVLDRTNVMMAVGSRWQPHPATEVIEEATGLFTDPSQVVTGRTSKIVIDATMQLPEEGGQEEFPKLNRTLLVEGAPGVFDRVDAKFTDLLAGWKAV